MHTKGFKTGFPKGLVDSFLYISEIKLNFHCYLLLFTLEKKGSPLYCYSISSNVQGQTISNVFCGTQCLAEWKW